MNKSLFLYNIYIYKYTAQHIELQQSINNKSRDLDSKKAMIFQEMFPRLDEERDILIGVATLFMN